jgi:hypothetical protein
MYYCMYCLCVSPHAPAMLYILHTCTMLYTTRIHDLSRVSTTHVIGAVYTAAALTTSYRELLSSCATSTVLTVILYSG